MKLRILTLLLALTLLLSLAACTAPVDKTDIKIYTLNGTTGFGMAKLMSNAKTDEAFSNYSFEVKENASMVNAAIMNGTADIAALPTNAAAILYNKTQGKVKILAVNTLGCLYLLTNQNATVNSFADLKGKTVHLPAQNPTFIFKYLCEQNGLTVGKDVMISTYEAPVELQKLVAAGKIDVAVLPEPMVTIATANAKKDGTATLKVSMDLTEEWNRVSEKDSLVQGCIVVRTEFLEAHPDAVKQFLSAYKKSIEYLGTNLDEASQMIVDCGIFTNAAVAKTAIPKCNVRYVDGEAMKASMKTYLTVLHGINPDAIGGVLPADDFYYIP